MANADAWGLGWSLGAEHAQDKRALKLERQESEFQNRINELVQNRQNLQEKISSLKDANGQPLPGYNEAFQALQKNAQDIRELYHPDKNPGAIAKFGHMLTDALHMTSQKGRIEKDASKRASNSAKDEAAAETVASGAPVDPTIQQIRSQLAEINNSDMPEEDKAEARRAVFKINARPTNKLYKLPNGSLAYFDINRPDLIPPGAELYEKDSADTRKRADYAKFIHDHPEYTGTFEKWSAEQQAAGKPSTAVINEGLEALAKLHGFASFRDIPAEKQFEAMNYVIRKQALDRAFPTSTTTTTLKQNADNQWVPVTETNYKTPGGNITLADPLGSINTQSTTASQAAPQSPAPAAAPSSPTAPKAGNVGVGQPLFSGPNKEYSDAKTAYDASLDRVKTMDDNLKEALNGDQQAMLSLVANHIGMTLGAQKGARINQAVWNEAVASAKWLESVYAKSFHNDPQTGEMVFDGWKSGVTLTPEQMKQMVKLAHEKLVVAKSSLDRISQRLNRGVTHPSPSPTDDSQQSSKRHKIKIGDKFYTYNGTGDTGDIKNYTEVKQ